MDNSLKELEDELKRLTPRRTSPQLEARLERALGAPVARATDVARDSRDTSATPLRSWKWASWQLAAAAAVALTVSLGVYRWKARALERDVAATVQSQTVAQTPPVALPSADSARDDTADEGNTSRLATDEEIYRPVGATNLLVNVRDEGPIASRDDGAHRVRYQYLDTYTWKHPATNASVKWSVPRDEVRVIPARLN